MELLDVNDSGPVKHQKINEVVSRQKCQDQNASPQKPNHRGHQRASCITTNPPYRVDYKKYVKDMTKKVNDLTLQRLHVDNEVIVVQRISNEP